MKIFAAQGFLLFLCLFFSSSLSFSSSSYFSSRFSFSSFSLFSSFSYFLLPFPLLLLPILFLLFLLLVLLLRIIFLLYLKNYLHCFQDSVALMRDLYFVIVSVVAQMVSFEKEEWGFWAMV